MDLLFMGIAVIIIIAALMYFWRLFLARKQSAEPKKKKGGQSAKHSGGFVNCPVCGTLLIPGENLISKVFVTNGQVNDQICYIYGCPHCYPKCEHGVKRTCPVCHKDVAQNQYLLARRFNKTKSGTPHVIVNGCGNCNRH